MHGKRISMGRMKWDDVAAADVRERVKLGDICEKIKGEHWIGCKKGFLTKKKLQKKFIFSSGNKRWFVMINRYLCYFSSRKEQETGAHPKGAFADLLAVKGIDLISERTIILAFEDGENEEELVADCHDDAIAWVRAMRARMQFFKRQRKMLIRRSSSKLLDLDGDDGGAVNPRSSPPDVDSQMSSSDNWLSLFAVPAVVPNCEKNNGPTSKPRKDSGATRRQHVIAEILSTEERYIESMHILIHAYRNVAKHYCGQSGWRESRRNSNIGFVDPVACETLEEAVGTLLGQYAHFFLMYKGYIHNFEHSQAHLQNELKAKRSWASHCKEQMKVMGGISIQSLLIMPVQRLPRYRLLVKELLKSTTGDAPFRTSLEEALGNVERALSAANEGA
eukprot:g2226.t1